MDALGRAKPCPIPTVLSPPQVYGIFYATSFLELYRSPHNSTTSAHNITVLVQRDEQYLFLVGSLPPLPPPGSARTQP